MLKSYEAFNVENAADLFRGGADEIAKVDAQHKIVVGRVVVCADKIENLIKKTPKEFETSIHAAMRERLRLALEKTLGIDIRTTGQLWELLRGTSRNLNNIAQVSKEKRIRAQKICTCLSDLFPD